MHIRDNLFQFTKEHALLVVCAKTTAKFLYAHNGRIQTIDSFTLNPASYSDNEGFTMRYGKSGNLYKSGRLRKTQHQEQEQQKTFLRTIRDRLERIMKTQNISDIYLFAPGYTTKTIRESWPQTIQKKVRRSIRGNYTNHHPHDLIQKISKKKKEDKKQLRQKQHNLQTSREARKILQRTMLHYHQR